MTAETIEVGDLVLTPAGNRAVVRSLNRDGTEATIYRPGDGESAEFRVALLRKIQEPEEPSP